MPALGARVHPATDLEKIFHSTSGPVSKCRFLCRLLFLQRDHKEIPMSQTALLHNRLLASLPRSEFANLLPKLKQVPLEFNETIFEPGDVIRHVYFPDSGIISLLAAVDGRSTLEVGIVGNEGVVGLSVFAKGRTSNYRAVVQGEGSAMRMKASDFLAKDKDGGRFSTLVLRYMHSFLTQVSQSAACNRFHPVDARLARWLLMTHDRMQSDRFRITQDFLSNMLGIRREAVSKAAADFQRRDILSYSRGNLIITDRRALQKAACPCYQIIKKEFDDFLTA
jgi:CRP-like cAMP-binding protein